MSAAGLRSSFDLFGYEKRKRMPVMADRKPAGEVFHSCFVDPDFSVAGNSVYVLTALSLAPLDIFGGIWGAYQFSKSPRSLNPAFGVR
jgi:hypothetical protein